MAEENQVQQVMKEPQQIRKEPQGEASQVQVSTKNPKKVLAGKRLAEHNCKKREAKKREEQVQLERIRVNQYYGIGAVIALGVIGDLGYHIYRSKKSPVTREVMMPVSQQPRPQVQLQTNKFEMD